MSQAIQPSATLPPKAEELLAREMAAFQRELQRLLAGGEQGRWALVQDDVVVNTWDTFDAAGFKQVAGEIRTRSEIGNHPETGKKYLGPCSGARKHRIGGIEKQNITGNVNYDPENHQLMVMLRQRKVDGAVADVPQIEVFGDPAGKVLVLGWGSTYGSITSAVEKMRNEGKSVSSAHLRYLNPFPGNLEKVLRGFETVLIPEMNLGQLCTMIRARYLIDAVAFSKVKGRPFQIREIISKVEEYL